MTYRICPFYKEYHLDPDDFDDISIDELGFSIRLYKRLKIKNIVTVSDLLKTSESSLREIRGFGKGCFDELYKYFNTIKQEQKEKTKKNRITDEVLKYKDRIANNDFSFLLEKEFSEESLNVIKKYKEAYELLDSELIDNAIKGSAEIMGIYKALREYIKTAEEKTACMEKIKCIPLVRKDIDVDWMIFVYAKDDKETERNLYRLRKKTKQCLEEYFYSNIGGLIEKKSDISRFLNWCSFDVLREINEFFDDLFKKDRNRFVIESRANKATLEMVGKSISVTRERVRQIEDKVARKFCLWERNNSSLLKIFTDLNEKESLLPYEIEKYVGDKYGRIYLHLLKINSKRLEQCKYEKKLDLFFAGENNTVEESEKYVLDLPDIFSEDKLKEYLNCAELDYGFSHRIVLAYINSYYKKTGKVYHNNRLSLANIYADILKRYYPDGIHIYDDEEIDRFKHIVLDEYGIELDQGTRAIGSVISRVGILCGRGIYKYNYKMFISEALAKRIHDYISNNESSVFLINTLFSVFEDELTAEGIENKYYLQGILHNLFGDEWFFKRDYISKSGEITTIYSDVVNYIKESKYPVKKEEIFKAFPGITEIMVNFAVGDFEVINLFGVYIHESKLKLQKNDIEYLKRVVTEFVDKGSATHCKDIYNYVISDYESLLKNNYIDNTFCMYSLLEHLFREEYTFSRPYVTKKGAEIETTYDKLREMINESDRMVISDILVYARTNHLQINSILEFLNECNDTHLLINSDEIASIDIIGVNEDVASEIERIILEEISGTIPISQLRCVARFPCVNVQWTEWLIYSIINKWGSKVEVDNSANQFKNSIPLIAKKGQMDVSKYKNLGSDDFGEVFVPDDLSNIDELISDYSIEDLEGLDDIQGLRNKE